jgi:hypothetical protein
MSGVATNRPVVLTDSMREGMVRSLQGLGLEIAWDEVVPWEDRINYVNDDPMKRIFSNPTDSLIAIAGGMSPAYASSPLRVEGSHIVTHLNLRNKGSNGHVCFDYVNPVKKMRSVVRLDVVFYALFVSERKLAECGGGFYIRHTCGNRQCMAPGHLELEPFTKKAKAEAAAAKAKRARESHESQYVSSMESCGGGESDRGPIENVQGSPSQYTQRPVDASSSESPTVSDGRPSSLEPSEPSCRLDGNLATYGKEEEEEEDLFRNVTGE